MKRFFLAIILLSALSLSAKELSLGDDAPDFRLPDQEGFIHNLIQHRGQYVLLFFYPRDFTPESVREVRAFQRAFESLQSRKITIYGISNDQVETHRKFHQKSHLIYDLLSDPEESMIKAYQAKGWIETKRLAYLIGPDGRIFKSYGTANPAQIIQDLATLR